MKEISNTDLTLEDVPMEDAGISDILSFALTYNGYERSGSFEACADIANNRRHNSLSDLRTCLFFEQRRLHFTPIVPMAMNATCDSHDSYLRALIAGIRAKLVNGERD